MCTYLKGVYYLEWKKCELSRKPDKSTWSFVIYIQLIAPQEQQNDQIYFVG